MPSGGSTVEPFGRTGSAVNDQRSGSTGSARDPAEPRFTLPKPQGWNVSKRRELPPADEGFSVAYDHESGMAVTLYQFTRGRRNISNDLESGPILEEMINAQKAIQTAVELGYWDDADKIEQKIVSLGKSPQKARWCRFRLKSGGRELDSDLYVWAFDDAIFKIRCTGTDLDTPAAKEILNGLFTEIGNCCK